MTRKKKNVYSFWLIVVFVKSTFVRGERDRERQRSKMVVECGPYAGKFLPSVEITEHLL